MNTSLLFIALALIPGLRAEGDASLGQAVLRLFHYREAGGTIEALAPVGTAFLVNHADALFLVSAGHMAAAGDLYARVPVEGGTRPLLIPRSAWVRHASALTAQPPPVRLPGAPPPPPVVKPTDVAVARVAWPETWCPAAIKLCENCPDPELAEPVIAAGYPGQFAAQAHRQTPLLRQGIVAMKPGEPAIMQAGENALLDARAVVLDMLTLAGNSGSPVFAARQFPARRLLLGLVTSGDPELAIAFAEPLSRIVETVRQALHAGKPQAEFHTGQ